MPKHKQPKHRGRASAPPPPLDGRQQGLRAFHAGHFDQAIALWAAQGPGDARVTAALAEAYFRRALIRETPEERLADLRQAVARAPDDPHYGYQVALELHRAGDLPAAIAQYQAVLARPGAPAATAAALALAALEQNPCADLAALPGSSPATRAALAPVQALLCATPPTPPGDEGGLLDRLRRAVGPSPDEAPLGRLWHGLAQLQQEAPAARATLEDSRGLPTPTASAVRRYYAGVAAARAGDLAAARQAWQQAYGPHLARTWLWQNLAAAVLQELDTLRAAGDMAGAGVVATQAAPFAWSSPALAAALLQTLDEAAHVAAQEGAWERAAELWEQARLILGLVSSMGSPRVLLHNLALAYEAQDHWYEAADAWRAMLRTRPRRTAVRGHTAEAAVDDSSPPPAATPPETSEAQWAWVRKRVIECYKRAGAPEESVTIFRQAIKADPSDLDLRLELVEALLANDQEQAALNELNRIREIDPQHVEAQLRLAGLHIERGEWYAADPILRGLLAREPDRPDVRRALASLLLAMGRSYHDMHMYAEARRYLEEGAGFAPDDYQFPLALARIAVDQRDLKRARGLLDRVLELGADQPMAYVYVIECWAVADKIAEARAVLAQAEAAVPLTAEFYVVLGLLLLKQGAAPPPPVSPFALLAPPPPPKPARGPWVDLGQELLQRAVARQPEDAQLRLSIAGQLLQVNPALGLPYAEEAVRLLPDDPHALLLLGLLQGLTGRGREAKETLRRAARLARQQGDTALAQHLDELRRVVDSPMLHAMVQLGPLLGELDELDEPF